MTAVAPPPNFQPVSRWSAGNGGLNSMSADEVSRMFMGRKTVPRTNSSSSIASNSSANSTLSASSAQSNGTVGSTSDAAGWGTKKKQTRGIWPASKAEPTAGLSNARPQLVANTSSGPSAQSAMNSLHSPSPLLPSSQQAIQQQIIANGMPNGRTGQEPPALLHLLPMNGTFERKTITVPYYPEVLKIGRQTNQKTIPTPSNGYFDSKVLSRQHAEVWADRNGKIYIRDVKSSNGTFVNGQRLSPENRDSDPHELKEQDMLELGIDIVSEDQKTVVHHKVAARVEHAGVYSNPNSVMELNFTDLDPSSGGNLLLQPLNQNGSQIRGRTGSQGSANGASRMGSVPASVAGSNMAGMGQQRHTNFWLQPISMEQIVKRLNADLKQAREQNQDLQRTGQYLDSIIHEPKKDDQRAPAVQSAKSPVPRNDIKARFPDPPAPPPQQPLPEKPDAGKLGIEVASAAFPSLRRVDTERPRSQSNGNSPTKGSESSSQINQLMEALQSAKKELDSQSIRLRDLEGMLAQERQARESAEERAERLEQESNKMRESDDMHADDPEDEKTLVNGILPSVQDEPALEDEVKTEVENTAAVDVSTARLQQRLEQMVAEMDEMKQQMERYRRRAEKAEEESETTRQTLEQMVERIRREEADREEAAARAQKKKPSHDRKSSGVDYPAMNGSATKVAEKEVGREHMANGHVANGELILRKAGVQNGQPISQEQVAALEKAVSEVLVLQSNRHDQLLQAAPYASILSVVLLGVGMMAYLNGWQKIER